MKIHIKTPLGKLVVCLVIGIVTACLGCIPAPPLDDAGRNVEQNQDDPVRQEHSSEAEPDNPEHSHNEGREVSDGTLTVHLPPSIEKPLYCIVATGPRQDKKMVAILDGEQLYFDLDGNGIINNESERFEGKLELELDGTRFVNFYIGDIQYESTKHTDTNFRIGFGKSGVRGSVSMLLNGTLASSCSSQALEMTFANQLDTAPIVHFGGDLTIDLDQHPVKLVRGKQAEFYIHVGTAGRGLGTLTAIAHADIPEDLHPSFEFEFRNSEAGGEPIIVKGYLDRRC